MSKDLGSSPLIAAAMAFDAELRRFARAAEAASKRELVSKRDLERAAEALKEAAEAEQELGPRAQALLQALTAARDEQQAQSESVRGRADEVQRRYQLYGGLMERVRQIGEEAMKLTEMARDVTGKKRDDQPLHENADVVMALVEIERRLARAAEDSRQVTEDARGTNFEEVARDAHALQQTLTATKNKITLLQKAIGVPTEKSDA